MVVSFKGESLIILSGESTLNIDEQYKVFDNFFVFPDWSAFNLLLLPLLSIPKMRNVA